MHCWVQVRRCHCLALLFSAWAGKIGSINTPLDCGCANFHHFSSERESPTWPLSFLLAGKCLRSTSSRRGLWYLPALSDRFWGPTIICKNVPAWSSLAKCHKQCFYGNSILATLTPAWESDYGIPEGNSGLFPRQIFRCETEMPYSCIPHPCFCRWLNTVCGVSIWAVCDSNEVIFPLRILWAQRGHSGYFYRGFANLPFCCVSRTCYEVT